MFIHIYLQGVSLLKPQLVRKLASGEVYFLAYSHLFPEAGPLYSKWLSLYILRL